MRDNDLIGAYATAIYPDGVRKEKFIDHMYIQEKVRPKNKKTGEYIKSTFWENHPEPMYIKSAIIHLSKFLSGKSKQLDAAIELDHKQYNTIEGEKPTKQEKVIDNPAQHVLNNMNKVEDTIDMTADMTQITEKEALEAVENEVTADDIDLKLTQEEVKY